MAPTSICAERLEINGVVQGVGFRPFLFGLAKTHGLLGQVSNTAGGLDLFIQGPPGAIEAFTRDIIPQKPLLSQIKTIESAQEPIRELTGFEIVKSTTSQARSTLISPDVSICEDCLAEMSDPEDPRFEYPFINCTNCGPRYTIIRDVPYDRPKTSMASFVMCPSCQAEYDNPLDRRFHAQPNACPLCGPQVFLTDNTGQRLDREPGHALDLAAQLLGDGKILAVKGLGGFHLAVNAADETAVSLLRQRKNINEKVLLLWTIVNSFSVSISTIVIKI